MGIRKYLPGIVLALLLLQFGCTAPSQTKVPRRDINEVLAAHQAELLAIPGVVGVYIGLMEDEKTECIKLMLKNPDRATDRTVPKHLEDYAVLTEITGEIRPMRR